MKQTGIFEGRAEVRYGHKKKGVDIMRLLNGEVLLHYPLDLHVLTHGNDNIRI